jgi:hypothetical protein
MSERNSISLYMSLNDLSSKTTTNFLKRSNTKTYEKKEKPELKRTKTISILPTVKLENTNNRKDVFGNPIFKGNQKKYKVTFRDNTSNKSLVQVIPVTSYKDFYHNEDDEENTKIKCNCGCIIF